MVTSSAFPTVLPVPRPADPALAPALRWGVLAPGGIARSFADAVHHGTRHSVVAVGSRSAERGAAFAAEFGVDRVHASYQALVDDPQVQAVYVASPHHTHAEQALLAIAAGKPVLVEKPFSRNVSEARRVVAAASSAGVLVMEAMWTRFLPGFDVIRQLLADGVLGEVHTVLADHGQYFPPDPGHRLFDPARAGGALLDLGVYPVSFASFALGAPDRITAVGELGPTGVDLQVSAVLRAGTAQAALNTTLRAKTPTVASISGSQARVEVAGPFFAPAPVTLTHRDGRILQHQPGPITGGRAMAYEVAHFAELVVAGATESPLLPLSESVSVMATLDEIRRQIGLRYPGE